MPERHHVYLILGGNLGNVEENFRRAILMLGERFGKLLSKSSLYMTEPWGMDTPYPFYNQAVCFSCRLHPTKMMKTILAIERKMGRRRTPGKMASRPIDIDILLIDGMVISGPDLQVPHPRLHLRRFALQPLAEIAPGLLHPVFAMSMEELLENCTDPLSVSQLPGQEVNG